MHTLSSQSSDKNFSIYCSSIYITTPFNNDLILTLCKIKHTRTWSIQCLLLYCECSEHIPSLTLILTTFNIIQCSTKVVQLTILTASKYNTFKWHCKSYIITCTHFGKNTHTCAHARTLASPCPCNVSTQKNFLLLASRY